MKFNIFFEITEDEVLQELEGLDKETIQNIIHDYFDNLLEDEGQGIIIQVDMI